MDTKLSKTDGEENLYLLNIFKTSIKHVVYQISEQLIKHDQLIHDVIPYRRLQENIIYLYTVKYS